MVVFGSEDSRKPRFGTSCHCNLPLEATHSARLRLPDDVFCLRRGPLFGREAPPRRKCGIAFQPVSGSFFVGRRPQTRLLPPKAEGLQVSSRGSSAAPPPDFIAPSPLPAALPADILCRCRGPRLPSALA